MSCQLDHGEVMQPAAQRNLLEIIRQLLRLLEGRLFLHQKLDLLGSEQAGFVFLELGIERGSGEAGAVHARLGRFEQLDEVGLGPGDGNAVLVGQGLKLLHGQSVQVGDLSPLESCLELRVFSRLRLHRLFDGLGREHVPEEFSRGFRPLIKYQEVAASVCKRLGDARGAVL